MADQTILPPLFVNRQQLLVISICNIAEIALGMKIF